MIVDSLRNCKTYLGLHPRFSQAFEYLSGADLSLLVEGRHEIDGDRIFMTVSRGGLKPAENAPLEAHDRYIDIQIVLEGQETYGWSDRSALSDPRGGFDPERDIIFFDDAPSVFFTLRPGQMAVFFPADAHAPMIGEGCVKKCVVKVLL